MNESITFVCVTQNRVENLHRNLPVILPFVDAAVIVDGGSSDGTQEYLESLGPKVKRVYRKWDDNFSNQYNEYLKHIDSGWILICDDDELPSIPMLESLRPLILESNLGENFSVVEFQCNNIDPIANWDSGPTNYFRQMFFRKTSRMKYVVDLHQALIGYQNHRVIRRKELYYHIKTRKQEFQNACRNYFIGGYWPQGASHPEKDPAWFELKNILARCYPEIKYFSDLNNVLIQGHIHSDLLAWIRKYQNIDGSGYGELRAYATYYFELLHPDEV